MLNISRLKEFCKEQKIGIEQLAERIVGGGLDKESAIRAIKNWQKGLMKPKPTKEDIKHLAEVFSVEANNLSEWRSFYRYAPGSARKAQLVTQLIAGRSVQDAIDILKFTRKRASPMVEKVLKTAVAVWHMGEAKDLAGKNHPIAIEGNVKLGIAGLICLGFFIGGLIGANLVQGLSDPLLKRLFGIFLLVVSLRMILTK